MNLPLVSWLRAEGWPLLAASAAHLELVLEAILLAGAVGIPLGVLASRSRAAERVVLAAANVLQTIPGLALLGFLLIAFGGAIGKAPSRAALVVYALLPIIRNATLGLRGVDPDVAEAARAMGMTGWQRLRLVEIPLAMPVMLGGVRVAAVAAVGMATIAAAIGAPGLGTYIFAGVQLSDPRQVLMGAIPAAGLALLTDFALGELERALDPRRARRNPARRLLATVGIGALLALALWGAWRDYAPRTDRRPTIVVGSKDSAEGIILGHMLADLVEAHTPLRAERKVGLGGTLVCYQALKAGAGGIDAYVEYTGTALMTILKEPPATDPAAVLRTVRAGCARRDGVACLDSLGFENTFALVARRETADRLGLRTIGDLRRHLGTIRIGFGPEFGRRPDGFPGMARAYGLDFAIPPREMDRNLLYEAVARGTIDVGVGDSTDGRVVALGLVGLEDDRRFFPPYEAVPLVKGATLEAHPALRSALDRLAGRIGTEAMQRLNGEVDGKHRPPAEVAREFLDRLGLLTPSPARPPAP